MKELAAPWKALGEIPQSVANRSGIAFLACRIALKGRSVLILAEDERAESLGEDLKALSSSFDEFKKWSVGSVPFESPREKNALLEDAAQCRGILWAASKEAAQEPCLSKKDFAASRLTLKSGQTLPYQKFIGHLSEQ